MTSSATAADAAGDDAIIERDVLTDDQVKEDHPSRQIWYGGRVANIHTAVGST